MSGETYFALINWLLLINTVWVVGFAVLCFIWTAIARTSIKKTIFAAVGGGLFSFVGLRLIVAFLLPSNLELLVLIGALHGLMMFAMFFVFLLVTVTVRRRTHELDAAEQCRAEACQTPVVEQWQSVESKLMAFGREAGWL